MGLLDEAIRDHLELKRRSGADPTSVERAEREALAPVFPEADAGMDGDGPSLMDEPNSEEASAEADVDLSSDPEVRLAHFQTVGQDTAELDMEAVMQEDIEEPAQERPSFE